MIDLGHEICSNFQSASSREWLETNGIGGYASSTISGANTRRYHGLLIAATRTPLGRVVMLSRLEETVTVDGEVFELSCDQYPGVVHPRGYRYLTRFRLDPFPVWTFQVGKLELEKKLFMVHGENTSVVSWSVNSGSGSRVLLEVRPLVAFRDHHHLRHEDPDINAAYGVEDGVISLQPYSEMPALHLGHNSIAIEKRGEWYRNFCYTIEEERGFDFTEDLFQPFAFKFDLAEKAIVIASTEPIDAAASSDFEAAEIARRRKLIDAAGVSDDLCSQLVLAADQFIVSRGTGKTVIAGYPWFSDWGRDTMIALPGLTLVTGRPGDAKLILTEFSKHISQGMLPNRFPDAGEIPEYNTVDATLWFFEAIRAYVEFTDDMEFVRSTLYPKLVDIIEWHIKGTRYNIHLDTDGLLFAGEPGVQLTWMDAKIGDEVITPRTGKPVEIQALWYNALCVMRDLASECGGDSGRYAEMASVARDSFNGQFWNDEAGSLFDVINGSEKDASIRPNQIFAVSLTHSILNADRWRKVVDKVEAELLTPFGLRSLSPTDLCYVPIYIGSPRDRDSAYHQGTVWGWLIGGFVDAYRKVHDDETARQKVEAILTAFREHLREAALGQVSEIFDGEPPHRPRGCGAQAWSVAELLRIAVSSRVKA